ncbi:hypothetical protein ACOSQ4_005976 [Xanthoceras sorbifolium]
MEAAIDKIKENARMLACRQLEKIQKFYNWKWKMHYIDATEVFLRRGDHNADEAWEMHMMLSNFLMSSFAINSLALSDGWYSSQNTYLLLSLHNVDAGKHVRAGRILPNEQHGESEFLNPTNKNSSFVINFLTNVYNSCW